MFKCFISNFDQMIHLLVLKTLGLMGNVVSLEHDEDDQSLVTEPGFCSTEPVLLSHSSCSVLTILLQTKLPEF